MIRTLGLALLACATAPPTPPSPTVTTVVAAEALPPGWTIEHEHLVQVTLPEPLPPGFQTAYAQAEDVVGRVVSERILPGEPVREERLADPFAGSHHGHGFVRGMRAMRVPVAHPAHLAHVHPGDFVDVFATCVEPDGHVPQRTLVQSASVLAVAEPPPVGPHRPHATLSVTPKDAEILKHAVGPRCHVQLAGRSPGEVTSITSNGPPSSP
ncbi:MAG: Flp pilus assembly protein CpaB [Myxococcales bacterium]|nr:Flp pilus assembly protein CpaB [Myxococcales bacterium]